MRPLGDIYFLKTIRDVSPRNAIICAAKNKDIKTTGIKNFKKLRSFFSLKHEQYLTLLDSENKS